MPREQRHPPPVFTGRDSFHLAESAVEALHEGETAVAGNGFDRVGSLRKPQAGMVYAKAQEKLVRREAGAPCEVLAEAAVALSQLPRGGAHVSDTPGFLDPALSL
jgi:hypothetical protein